MAEFYQMTMCALFCSITGLGEVISCLRAVAENKVHSCPSSVLLLFCSWRLLRSFQQSNVTSLSKLLASVVMQIGMKGWKDMNSR